MPSWKSNVRRGARSFGKAAAHSVARWAKNYAFEHNPRLGAAAAKVLAIPLTIIDPPIGRAVDAAAGATQLGIDAYDSIRKNLKKRKRPDPDEDPNDAS